MNFFTTTQLIAKEGWRDVFFAGAIFVLAWLFSFMSWFFFLVFAGIAFLYRNPERIAQEEDENAIIAPVDGVVRSIEQVSASDGKKWLKVVIQKRFFDVGVVRSPMEMSLKEVYKKEGLPLASTSSLSPILRAKASFVFQKNASEVRMILYTGAYSRTINFASKRGRFKVGERLAFLSEGDVGLLLPLDARIKVVLNDEIKAGESVLGYLAHTKVNHE